MSKKRKPKVSVNTLSTLDLIAGHIATERGFSRTLKFGEVITTSPVRVVGGFQVRTITRKAG